MADGFLAGHVPQQCRRDKLRIHSHLPISLPLYDPSNFPSSSTSDHVQDVATSTLPSYRCTLPDPRPTFSASPNHIPDATNPSFLCSTRQWGYPSVGGILTSASEGNNGQGLSLSLSSRVNRHGNDDQRNPPFELNLESYGSVAVYGGDKGGGGGGGDGGYVCEVPRSSGPLGPFTGYSSILGGSRFLKPAQKLLEDLCDAGRGMFYADTVAGPDPSLMVDVCRGFGSADGCELGGKKSMLISMLDELCRRYMQYYQQLQDVVASFECVAGLGNAAPYVNFALKATSKRFRCLKDAIMDQLQSVSKVLKRSADPSDDDIAGMGRNTAPHFGQRAIKNSGFLQQQPVWRPQRGLPERAVAVLRAWLFEHFLHPYPTDTDKLMLAKQTGLSRCQVSNWFINARVRLWKPMVEEIHTLETQQMQGSQLTRGDETVVRLMSNDRPPVSNSVPLDSATRVHETLSPGRRTEGAITFADLSSMQNEQMQYRQSHILPGRSIGNSTSSSVTLTLGLHNQHNNSMATGFGVGGRNGR